MTELFLTIRRFFEPVVSYITPTLAIPFAVIVCLVVFFRYYHQITQPFEGTTEWIDRELSKQRFSFFVVRHPMEKKDAVPLLVLTAVFSFLALFNLGDMRAPQSFFQFNDEKETITIELQSPEDISSLMFYTGLWTSHYVLEFSADGLTWLEQKPANETDANGRPVYAMDQPHSHLFKWRYAELNNDNPPVLFVRITPAKTPIELGEIVLYGANGERIPAHLMDFSDARELFDEQELVPPKPEYMNSMYFDEIYHGRTALEYLRKIRPYETTHPPLGKEIIAASIYAFGMTPFGWRFIGAVFGVILLIVMYIFLKNMFGKTIVALCGSLLLGFDFMRFVQTRIATIDTYGVFFILLSFFFMYRHITTDPDAPFKKSLAPLALSGLSFGLGCASKWIVPYAGAGLAVIYCLRLIMLFRHYDEKSIPGFRKYLVKTLLFSVVFFVIVPGMIYSFSYIPYGFAADMTISGGMLWDPKYSDIISNNQAFMLNYHSNLNATHPYSSSWYQWLIIGRPILYYNSYSLDGSMRSSFAAFGNPAIWWGGLVAMVFVCVNAVRQRDGKAVFILIGYFTQLLPWVAVSRIVFIYHYFPSTLFLVMALAYIFNVIRERGFSWHKHMAYGFTALAGLLFCVFYPVLTGVYVPFQYFRVVLRWFPGAWPF